MSEEASGNDLYQNILLDHARNPVGYGVPESFDLTAKGVNRLCGDTITIYLSIEGEKVSSAAFAGESCAICKGSASMMMKVLPGMNLLRVQDLIQHFEIFSSTWNESEVPEFKALKAVERFPTRLKCLKLPWKALQAAISRNQQSVTTE